MTSNEANSYRLYGEFAHRYDVHTPPGHYKHDHEFVIQRALAGAGFRCRLLDIGCGTGVFLEAALAAGIDAYGIDAAPEMIAAARTRVDRDRIRVIRMQELVEKAAYDVVCALSWTIHYCEDAADLAGVLGRCHGALRPQGQLILQVANDEKITGAVNVDREPGQERGVEDTLFIHRFRALHDTEHSIWANYMYASPEHGEMFAESHLLRFGNPLVVSAAMRDAGFTQVTSATLNAVSPFLIAHRD